MNENKRPLLRCNIGDKLTIRSDSLDCIFGTTEEMREMMGRTVTVSDIDYSGGYGDWEITLEEDPYHWSWCRNCFLETNNEIRELCEFEAASQSDIVLLFS